jgi:succinate dehydrogenase/fumarate reductase flavoprotein subunit
MSSPQRLTTEPPADEVDVIVLGSGAAGLVAALAASDAGATVALFERAGLLGGATAISGGVCWVPMNHHMDEAGIADSREEALRYLDSLSLGQMDPELARAFVDGARGTVEWLEQVTDLQFTAILGYPDYHPEHPGGRPEGGRSLDPGLFSYHRLGPWASLVAASRRSVRLRITDTTIGGGTGFLDDETLAHREEHDLRGCGAALVGPLLAALLAAGVEPVLKARANELVIENGRVCGVRIAHETADQPDAVQLVRARRGVIIATGGFEWNPDLVTAFLRGPMTAPASVPSNEGDGLVMAMRAGASLANMPQAWWAPTVRVPGDEAFGRPRATLLNRERTLPGSIMVNQAGLRFANEAANYNALGGAFHHLDPADFGYSNLPCWLVFDGRNARTFGSFGTPAGAPIAPWIARADTLADLAGELGIDATNLTETVNRWNAFVDAGDDADFGRGRSAYDRWSGDGRHRGELASTLGRIDEAPFFAVEVHAGTLGTSGGPRTDAHGRVLDTSGTPIPGLFAAGNAAAAPTALAYGGAGGTLGPIIVFGRAAGLAAAHADSGSEHAPLSWPVE